MIKWIYYNANHIVSPFVILISGLASYTGYVAQRKRKAGLEPPYTPKWFQIVLILLLLLGCVFFGMLLVRNFV